MKQVTAKVKADWNVVLEADGKSRASRDFKNLLYIVGKAMPLLEQELARRRKPTLALHPGLLARYDQLGLLERLRDNAGRPDAIPLFWLLIPSDRQSRLPMIDRKPLPILASAQWARIPPSWIRNQHRA